MLLTSRVWTRSSALQLTRRLVRNYSPRNVSPIRRANLFDEPTNVQLPSTLTQLVDQSVLVIERQIEMGSIIVGFEQGRLFRLYNASGVPIGHMEEVDLGLGKAIMRQVTRLHRPFKVRVFDAYGNHALTIQRPFSFINSHIRCYLPAPPDQQDNHESLFVGESKQEWHLWRRRYNLYTADVANQAMNQFGRVDAPFLSFQFPVADETEAIIGSVDRNWTGIGRELFTDTGVYFMRFSPDRVAESLLNPNLTVSNRPLTLVERVVMLATAISIDFDYFSRHSGGSGLMWFPFGDDV